MELNTLYQDINCELYKIMTMSKSDDLKSKSENILKILSENEKLLKEDDHTNLHIYIPVAIISILFSYLISNKFFPELSIMLVIGALVISFLITKFTITLMEYAIDASILLVHELSQKGWTFSTLDSVEKWEEWQSMYPFMNKGDLNDSIALRIYGDYQNFSFCYFEYDYTIEIEDEVEYEDSDGETYYETEYDYDDYTESGIIITARNNLPYIEISSGSTYSNALKFSYIDLNEKMSAYSSKPYEASSFFNPIMQRNFAKFYNDFPSSNISIDKNDVFINFGVNLMNIPRSIYFDDKLYSYIKRNNISGNIEDIMQSLLPILKGIN